jgi:hypothetical protein
MIKLMVMEFIIILMELCMKADGEMIYNMEKVKSRGQISQSMKENTWLVKSMELVFTVGMTDQSIMENGMKIKSKDSELIAG